MPAAVANAIGAACSAVSPPATPTGAPSPLRRQSSLAFSPQLHPAQLRANELFAGVPSATGSPMAVDSSPALPAAWPAAVPDQQPQRFEDPLLALATVVCPPATPAAAAVAASNTGSTAQQPGPAYSPAARIRMAAAAAAVASFPAVPNPPLHSVRGPAVAPPQQPAGLSHAPLLPARRSVEDWPSTEPAALIRSACSGPQPLLAALAEVQFGQVSSLGY